MEKLLSKQFILQNLGTFGVIVVIFTYSIFLDRDLACTCKQQDEQCNVYMFVPPCLILVLILWTRKTFLLICRKLYCCKFCFYWKDIFKSALIGLLWIAFVFIDGDWFVCCKNDHSKQQAQLACKTPANLTYEDRVIIAELKNKSRMNGIILLAGIVCVAALISWFEWPRICQRIAPKCCNCVVYTSSNKNIYYKMIMKEEEGVLKELLRESSKSQLTEGIKEKLCAEQWTECFDVAENLINQQTKPSLEQGKEPPIPPPETEESHPSPPPIQGPSAPAPEEEELLSSQ